MVSVAQLVEYRIVIPVVAGSSPVVHPIKSISYISFRLIFKCGVAIEFYRFTYLPEGKPG